MKKIILLLLVSIASYSQNAKIQVKVDSIYYVETNYKNREYYINYQVTNTTNKDISFFLIPNALIAETASSSTLYTVYKIYQNGIYENMDGPFFEYESLEELRLAQIDDINSIEFKGLSNTIKQNRKTQFAEYLKKYKDEGGLLTDKQWIYENERLLDNIVKLTPNESQKFTIKTLWNKDKFIKNDDLEFYLDDNKKIEFQLILDLKKVQFKDKLEPEYFARIEKDTNFIEGTFVSNKIEISFKE